MNTNGTHKLKPCPGCGSKKITTTWFDMPKLETFWYFCKCEDCGLPSEPTPTDAKTAEFKWNWQAIVAEK